MLSLGRMKRIAWSIEPAATSSASNNNGAIGNPAASALVQPIAAPVVAVDHAHVPDRQAAAVEGAVDDVRAPHLVQLVLVPGGDDQVAVAVARALVALLALERAAVGDRDLDPVAVGRVEFVGRLELEPRRVGVGLEHLDREVDLERVVVAPTGLLEPGHDRPGVGGHRRVAHVLAPDRAGREVAGAGREVTVAITRARVAVARARVAVARARVAVARARVAIARARVAVARARVAVARARLPGPGGRCVTRAVARGRRDQSQRQPCETKRAKRHHRLSMPSRMIPAGSPI